MQAIFCLLNFARLYELKKINGNLEFPKAYLFFIFSTILIEVSIVGAKRDNRKIAYSKYIEVKFLEKVKRIFCLFFSFKFNFSNFFNFFPNSKEIDTSNSKLCICLWWSKCLSFALEFTREIQLNSTRIMLHSYQKKVLHFLGHKKFLQKIGWRILQKLWWNDECFL